MDIDILCVGMAAYDLNFLLDRHLEADGKQFARGYFACGGGPAANAAVTAARLGSRTAFVGYLGRDQEGEKHLEELRRAGVFCDLVQRGIWPTPLSVILNKKDGSRSIVTYREKPDIHWNPVEILEQYNPGVMLFDGHLPELSQALQQLVEKRQIPTVLDAGSRHGGTEILWRKVNYLVASERFAREIAPAGEYRAFFRRQTRMGFYPVVITLGENGLVWFRNGHEEQLSAYSVVVRDTTGAGDVFHGAFCVGLRRGMDWQDLLQFASAAAALSCTKYGGRTSIPTMKEVQAFLRKFVKVSQSSNYYQKNQTSGLS